MDSRKRPFVIGLTGNIATGKSTVGQALANLGAQHVDADRLAHQAMAHGEPAWVKIAAHFGPDILGPDGEIDRQKLGAIVFADATALGWLESVIHPDVIDRTRDLLARTKADVVVIEAIKLIESGMAAQLCDAVWVVTAPRHMQIDRLVEQRGLERKMALLRIDAQPSQRIKAAQADVVIENGGGYDELVRQVKDAWQRIQHPAVTG